MPQSRVRQKNVSSGSFTLLPPLTTLQSLDMLLGVSLDPLTASVSDQTLSRK